MKHLEKVCQNQYIPFDAIGSHCRCFAHIMNLVVQDILKQIKAGEAQTEDIILDNIDVDINAGEVIPKVVYYFYNALFSFNCYYITNHYILFISFANL
jgi:hypothetical protein